MTGPRERPSRIGEAMVSFWLWVISVCFFFTVVPVLILVGIFVDPRRNDRPQRWMSRWVVKLAGGTVEVRKSPGFDPQRTCFLVSNHVNLFDPFVLYGVIPQFFRGLELESHFRIPVYGWLMKRFGNVPVPDVNRPSDLKRMWRMTQDALDSRREPGRLSRGQSHHHRPRRAVSGRRVPHGAAIRRADYAGQHRRLVRIQPQDQLDAAALAHRRVPARLRLKPRTWTSATWPDCANACAKSSPRPSTHSSDVPLPETDFSSDDYGRML